MKSNIITIDNRGNGFQDALDDLANHPIEVPEWDEYERSILRGVADSVKIAVRGGVVDMTVSKSII